MAGIAGILDTTVSSRHAELIARARSMSEQAPGGLLLRTDAVADESAGIALAATGLTEPDDPARLTISVRSESGRFLIAITGGNGPYTTLRKRLNRESDTSPIAAIIASSVELLGLASTLTLCDGPLALAVWDRAERTLSIGRDRFGQESLFAAWAGSSFIFGSHLFSLVAHPQFRRDIDPGSIAQYLRFSTFHSPATAFTDAVRINPGSMVTIRTDQSARSIAQISVAAIRDDAIAGINHRFSGSAAEATDALNTALQTSIRESTADPTAPLGIFFSGGVDSTLIAAVAAGMNERPIHAITAGFNETGYDESSHARIIANHLK
ncbi:MAG: asparagine synthase-related protein, partial [Thermomicrobiales bacterium]